jgi:hypothetical protein
MADTYFFVKMKVFGADPDRFDYLVRIQDFCIIAEVPVIIKAPAF